MHSKWVYASGLEIQFFGIVQTFAAKFKTVHGNIFMYIF